ncbi:MAG: hypothetical protein M3R13_07755 [Armatimonadota bacterium]|nr:hypothetical protein [Armatimonadota bacterium]
MAIRLVGAVCAAVFLAGAANAQLSGAVYTTLPDGTLRETVRATCKQVCSLPKTQLN